MKKLWTLLIVVFLGISATQAGTSYHLDNAAIDEMFARAELVDLNSTSPMAPLADMGYANQTFFEQDKDPLVAFLLSWFLGYLGIHRAYLGTSTGTIVGYILTLGGCGIVATIDWIMLLIGLVNNDISQYIDNPRFFMW
ncbi:MAG: TM2 domain-containing protein [Bacteroidetes bacterium]|nr:MAG: TM2 domain-containing protein [Bacteroidota bacterium]